MTALSIDTPPRLVDRHVGFYGDLVETWEHVVKHACGHCSRVLIDHYPQRSVDHGPRMIERWRGDLCDECAVDEMWQNRE